MNNSQIEVIAEEEVYDAKSLMRVRESKLIRMIEAIERVAKSADWNILKAEIFEPVSQNLEHKLMTEVKAEEINEPEIYRLQGQLVWARKYSKLEDLKEVFKVELSNIKKQINN
jgi:hypothetical protein